MTTRTERPRTRRGLSGPEGNSSHRRALLAGEVAGECAHLQVLVPASMSQDFDLPVALLLSCFLETDGVLRANVARDGPADFVNFVGIFGEESQTTRLLSHSAQGALSFLSALLAQDANGVNRGRVLVLHSTHHLLQRFTATVVLSMGDDQQHSLLDVVFLLQARAALLQIVG